MHNYVEPFLVISTIGLFCFGFGLAARLGYLKRMFITKGMPGVYPRNTVYAMMPLGIFFFSLLLNFLWGDDTSDRMPLTIVFWGLALLVIVSLVWQPRWLKPAWRQWLENNYGHVTEEMFEEARQMGRDNWEAQVETQADLEHWADSVAQKHGWQRMHRQ